MGTSWFACVAHDSDEITTVKAWYRTEAGRVDSGRASKGQRRVHQKELWDRSGPRWNVFPNPDMTHRIVAAVALLGLAVLGSWACSRGGGDSRAVPIQFGLDRIASAEVPPPAGGRIGLIVHAASVTADGSHAIDVLRTAGSNVTKLFAPEHGLRSRAADGEHIIDGHDPVSGLPVVSLYGESRKPRAEDLDLHALMFDLQGAGVRFYPMSAR